MRSALLAGLMLAAAASNAALAADTPAAVGEAFCKARLGNDDKATLALLTPSLTKAIDEALARNDIIAKANPDDKPPFGDGIPYQAFPDVPEGCEVGKADEKPGRVELAITYRFPSTVNADWTDRLKLVTDGGKLLIDDIIYANVANGEPDLSLRQVLFDAFDQ